MKKPYTAVADGRPISTHTSAAAAQRALAKYAKRVLAVTGQKIATTITQR